MKNRPKYKINDYIKCKCSKCGNTGLQSVKSTFFQVVPDYCDGEPIGEYYNDYYLLECPVCYGITLYSIEADTFSYNEYEEQYKSHIVYPQNKSFKNVPIEIERLYLSAKQTVLIDSNIALIAIRSLLEKICKDKGSKKKKLVSMLNELSSKGLLPEHLKNCSYLIRKLGNTGAHGDDVVLKNDVLKLIDFMETILYYLYDLPAEIDKFNLKYIELLNNSNDSQSE